MPALRSAIIAFVAILLHSPLIIAQSGLAPVDSISAPAVGGGSSVAVGGGGGGGGRSSAPAQSSHANYCALLGEIVEYCEKETVGFTQLPISRQASCFCGSTLAGRPWGPKSFDAVATDCFIQASASSAPTLESAAAGAAQICALLTQPAGASASSSAAAGGGGSPRSSKAPTVSSTRPVIGPTPSRGGGGGVGGGGGGSGNSQSSSAAPTTTNAAVRIQRQEAFGVGLAAGGLALGGYLMG